MEICVNLVLMLVLVLSVAGCGRMQEPAKSQQQAQSEQPLENHIVRGRFEPGPTDREVAFIFEVSPTLSALPKVRWVAMGGNDPRTLEVQDNNDGRYSVRLTDIANVSDGQVIIQLSNSGAGPFEIHGAEFALRDHVRDRPAARPSRDGRFQVFAKPEGVSPAMRLLIGSSEQPIEKLPPGVTHGAVAGVYSLDFLAAAHPDGWLLTMAVAPTDAKPAVFYLARGDEVWRMLNSTAIEGHTLLSASLAGPGTYLLVREVTR